MLGGERGQNVYSEAPSLPGCPLPVAVILSPRPQFLAGCPFLQPLVSESFSDHLSLAPSGKRWTQVLYGLFFLEYYCYGLDCVPPKKICCNSNPQYL